MKNLFRYILIFLILKEKIILFKSCSRLKWKNDVYYCKTRLNQYAIKFYNNKNRNRNFDNEVKMYNILGTTNNFNIPNIIFQKKYKKFNILILDWIDGISLKEYINENGIKKSEKLIFNMIKCYQDIWDINVNNIVKKEAIDETGKSMMFDRIGISMREAINYLITKNKNDEERYLKIFNIYNKLSTKSFNLNYLINSDISLHEVIYEDNFNKCYLIDFEFFTLGDINNDLAGMFYSGVNSIIKNSNDVDRYYSLICSINHFNLIPFLYYLIERFVSVEYLCYDFVLDFERNFFFDFIIKLDGLIKE